MTAEEHEARIILGEADINRALTRIAHEILEANKGSKDIILMGILRKGFPLAQRLADKLAHADSSFSAENSLGQLDITMYRDDLQQIPGRFPEPTQLPAVGIDGKKIVLVDDVLYSGRTIRSAMDALKDYGRPSLVRLAVLVDRGHRELPIRADFVGKNLPTSSDEKIRVYLSEFSGSEDRVELIHANARRKSS